jgi:hypothetical protein
LPEPLNNPPAARIGGQALPAELEARIAVLEREAAPSDFDALSWFWMVLIGLAIPILLLVVGWWA